MFDLDFMSGEIDRQAVDEAVERLVDSTDPADQELVAYLKRLSWQRDLMLETLQPLAYRWRAYVEKNGREPSDVVMMVYELSLSDEEFDKIADVVELAGGQTGASETPVDTGSNGS